MLGRRSPLACVAVNKSAFVSLQTSVNGGSRSLPSANRHFACAASSTRICDEKPMYKHAKIGLKGVCRYGGKEVFEVDVWQRDACLNRMLYPSRTFSYSSHDPDFRREDPVREAEAIDRAMSLRAKISEYLGESETKVPTILWEDTFEFCWFILPPKDEQGVKPPSRRMPANSLFVNYPDYGEFLHLGSVTPERVTGVSHGYKGLSCDPTPGGSCPIMRARIAALAKRKLPAPNEELWICLLYTSDAADE